MMSKNFNRFVLLFMLAGFIVCCVTTGAFGGTGLSSASGGAAGSTSANGTSDLEYCSSPLGTLSVFEDQSLAWWDDYRSRYPNLGSTTPVIRMLIQQSNCFVVVERGAAMEAMQRERQLMESGQLRSDSNYGQGQMVAADYTLSPSVSFKKSKMGKIKASGSSFLKKSIPGLGALSGGSSAVGVDSNQAQATLLMIDNRSGVQISSSIGSAKKYDFSVFGNGWLDGGSVGLDAYTSTDEGKVITAAFIDSYNQMVAALRNYTPQIVEGGLGTGGTLAVDGAVQAQPVATTQTVTQTVESRPVTVTTERNVSVTRRKNLDINIDEYDEDALEDYYDALKASVEYLGTFSGLTEAQVAAMEKKDITAMMAFMWAGPYCSSMETSMIELGAWPLEARQEGWAVLGKRITKYNELFERYREAIVNNKAYESVNIERLKSLELVTEENLLYIE